MACGWDEAVEDANHETIAERLFQLHIWLVANATAVVLTADLVRWFHQTIFGSVFPDAAGRVRGPWCPHPIKFGPHFGTPYESCEETFQHFSNEYADYVRALDSGNDDGRRLAALNVACAHHLEFVKIHPFVDGNGRTGRACVNYFALRYGLSLIETARDKMSDYELAIGEYIARGRRQPLVDLWTPIMMP